jgi:1-acyl-sn-glycerol-3-phosphate acyltransferase
MFYSFAKFILHLYFTLFYRVRLFGVENIPEKGEVLLFANHPSAWDMLLIASHMKRQVHFMAKVELYKNPILALILRKLGAFPVSRGKGDVGSVKTAFKLLQEGRIVGVFPEGTRTPKKNPQNRKAGAAMLAYHTNAPILPIGVKWNKKWFSKLEVVFGECFRLPVKKEDEHISKEELINSTHMIMDRIYALIGQ